MTFQQRLKKACRDGNLTVADLARWFRCPDATVRTWVEKGREPRGGPQDIAHVQELLKLLENLIQHKRYFPVPKLSLQKRVAYLKATRETVLP